MYQIKLLQQFSTKATLKTKPFTPKGVMAEILDLDVLKKVANGTLSVFSTKVKQALELCKIVITTEQQTVIDQNVFFNTKKLVLKKIVRHVVTWDSSDIHCSCNALVYSGLPCYHIIITAYKNI